MDRKPRNKKNYLKAVYLYEIPKQNVLCNRYLKKSKNIFILNFYEIINIF